MSRDSRDSSRDSGSRDSRDRSRSSSSGDSDRFQERTGKVTVTSGKGIEYVDYKDVESLRRMMTPNGKIYGRKRLGTNARQQRMVASAVKRARFLGLLPFTSATL